MGGLAVMKMMRLALRIIVAWCFSWALAAAELGLLAVLLGMDTARPEFRPFAVVMTAFLGTGFCWPIYGLLFARGKW